MSNASPASPHRKVLLVEDSPPLQRILAEAVRTGPGLELTEVAADVEDALAALARQTPDVVILDLVLRTGFGLDVLRAIRQRPAACCVVIFTGYDAAPFRARCESAGADHFFSKHTQHRELIEFLRTLGGDAARAGISPRR